MLFLGSSLAIFSKQSKNMLHIVQVLAIHSYTVGTPFYFSKHSLSFYFNKKLVRIGKSRSTKMNCYWELLVRLTANPMKWYTTDTTKEKKQRQRGDRGAFAPPQRGPRCKSTNLTKELRHHCGWEILLEPHTASEGTLANWQGLDQME